jgi:hypothetical protein
VKAIHLGLVLSLFPTWVPAQTVTTVLYWVAPRTNTDGTPLTDLAGYNVYKGTSPTTMLKQASVGPNAGIYIDSTVTSGLWYYYVTAVNSFGIESAPSAPVSKSIVAAAAARHAAVSTASLTSQSAVTSYCGCLPR